MNEKQAQSWAKCDEDQKNMVSEMCECFSLLSGLTEPTAWGEKVKLWLTPMVFILNATTWTEEGLRKCKRVMRTVIHEYVSNGVEIASVKSVQKRMCNVLGVTSFVPSDFPGLSNEEFCIRLGVQPKGLTIAESLMNDRKLHEAREFYESLEGETFEDKMSSFESMLYGGSNE